MRRLRRPDARETVALTLVGQYLAQLVPDNVSLRGRENRNYDIAGVFTPYFSSWISLLESLSKHAASLRLDFFPELLAATCVDVPPHFGLEQGKTWQGLRWLEPFGALRNGSAHAGMASGREEIGWTPWVENPNVHSTQPAR